MTVPDKEWGQQRRRKQADNAGKRAGSALHALRGWGADLWAILRETWQAFNDDDGGTHAAAIGYYALFSLFPIVVLLSLGLTYFVGETRARLQVMLIVGSYLPTGLKFVDDVVQNVLSNRGTLSILALVGILWGSMHIFRVLERSINQAWGAPKRRSFWRHLRFSLVMVVSTGVLTILSLAATALFRLARPMNLPFTHLAPLQNDFLWAVVSALPAFALTTTLFILLYRFVPHEVHVRWREVIISAVVAALFWEVAKQAFAFYMTRFAQRNYNLLYGSVGAIIGVLTWVYVTGFIILLGAELCAVISRRNSERTRGYPVNLD